MGISAETQVAWPSGSLGRVSRLSCGRSTVPGSPAASAFDILEGRHALLALDRPRSAAMSPAKPGRHPCQGTAPGRRRGSPAWRACALCERRCEAVRRVPGQARDMSIVLKPQRTLSDADRQRSDEPAPLGLKVSSRTVAWHEGRHSSSPTFALCALPHCALCHC